MTRSINREESLIHTAWNTIKHWTHWTPEHKISDDHGTYCLYIEGPRSRYVVVCKSGFYNETQVSVMRDRVLERALGSDRLLLVFVEEIGMGTGFVFNPRTVSEVGKEDVVRSGKGVRVPVCDVDVSYGVVLGEWTSRRVGGLPGGGVMSGMQTFSEYGESD